MAYAHCPAMSPVAVFASLIFAEVKINFQPAATAVPYGYLPDSGQTFADRGNGYSYGWDAPITKVYDRGDDVHPDVRYATTMYMDRVSPPASKWEIALDNDEYEVHIVCGDPLYTGQINSIYVEGTLLVDQDPPAVDPTDHLDEYDVTVTVSDGRLTIQSIYGYNTRLCFIDIVPAGLVNHTPVVTAGDDQSHIWPRNQISLQGTVIDDGKGNPDGYLAVSWTQISGPEGVTFTPGPDVAQPVILLPAPGNYTFELSATDGALSASDQVTIAISEPDCPVGDMTDDCKVDLSDLLLFAERWLTTDPKADLNASDGVNLSDMDYLSQSWLSDWTGSVSVMISPADAVAAGAQWRLDGGIWRMSGSLVDSIVEGEHIIDFQPIANWIEPTSQTIISYRQQHYDLSGNYVFVPERTLMISEFMAINSNLADLRPAPTVYYSTVVEGSTEYPDWIEIRNTTGEAISLDGWFLTDNPKNLTKWKFPNGKQVNANSYFVVYASNKDQWRYPTNYPYVDTSGNLHTNFDVGGDGGFLALVKPDGKTIAHEYIDYPKQRGLITYGVGSNDKTGFLKSVTRNAANDAAYDGEVADTKFSVDRGFYLSPISVAILCDTPGAAIRFTTDGSEPTLTNGSNYTGPIEINTTTCLRAAAFKDNFIPSVVDTHTYIYLSDVIRQGTNPDTGQESPPAAYPLDWGTGQSLISPNRDYQMDPDICSPSGLYGSTYAATIKDDLKAIPTLSIVMPKDNWFGSTGIYINQSQDGTERKASAELIDPSGMEPGFQVNCGVRMQGGVSGGGTSLDRWKTYKLSMRLVFRGGYGPSQLRYVLFPNEPAATDRFDTVVIEAQINNTWLHPSSGQQVLGQNTRDQFPSVLQNAMGGYSPHWRNVHLYLNGLYWGMYWIHERPDDSFAAAYFGGLDEDYDVLKHSVSGVVSGSNSTYYSMFNIPSTDYAGVQQYLDVPNFIDYMLVNYFLGNGDWSMKNWYASHNHFDPSGRWRYHSWDAEHVFDDAIDSTSLNQSLSPTGLHVKWIANEEYRMRFSDRVYKHFYNDGIMAPNNIVDAYQNLSLALVDRAVVGESARWGDNRRPSNPYTRNIEWMNERNRLVNTFFPGRRDVVIGQFRNKNPMWYPSIDPPLFHIGGVYQHGGNVATGSVLTLPSTNTVLYTMDGTDPRMGPSGAAKSVTFVAESAEKKVWVARDNRYGTLWTGGNEPFEDSAWTDGTPVVEGKLGAVGFETRPNDTISYDEAISYDVRSIMYGITGYNCAYIRIPFALTTEQLSDLGSLTLKVRYDDGFVAYLNGYEATRSSNYGTPGVPPAYDATASRSGDPTGFDSFDVTDSIGNLQVGENILAIHGANSSKTNSDFIVSTELVGVKTFTVGVSPTAIPYNAAQPPVLNLSRQIKTRAISATGEWSALNETTFAVGPVKESLRITEIMYHPADPNAEFIELQNIGTQAINLNVVKFTNGIDFTFGDTILAPNAYILVANNPAHLEMRYGMELPIAGQYTGLLDNKGERIRLVDAIGSVIHDFEYKDGWYDITDGQGFSLTIINAANPDPRVWGQKIGWRPSSVPGGSPGSSDSGIVPPPGAIVINEILSHSHDIEPDWIELYNTTADPIHIGGWFLSDSNIDDPNRMKYEIAEGTVIDGYDYTVFYQNQHFGNTNDSGCRILFALSEGGETVFLRSGLDGQLTGYMAEQDFGAAESGVAFGRYIKSSLDGGVNFVAMAQNTPNDLNSAPKVGPIVFTEIMYNPNTTNTGDEYIELKNITSGPVTLQDVVGTEISQGVFRTDIVTWRFTEGIDYIFPANTTIPAGGLLIVAKNPTALKSYYGAAIPANVAVLGPFANDTALSNGGEKIRLSRPGDQELGKERFWIRAEQVTYDDAAPWPLEPDGTGKVLKRITPTTYGNDVTNWQAANPSPGQ